MTNKLLSLLLAALMVFGLCSCGITAQDAVDLAVAVADTALASDSASDTMQDATAVDDTVWEDWEDYGDEYADEDIYDEAAYEEAEADAEAAEPDLDAAEDIADTEGSELLDPDDSYTSKEDVALYIHQYGCLPSNFITKKEAQSLGWSGGSLEPYAPGKCIGGSYFGNYEGILPTASGRSYTECDIDTLGASSRGAKRIVFSNDGLIYYTEDHYETFELLYGEP